MVQIAVTSALPIGGAVAIPNRYLTRHVGIFGATGTGKTTTLGAVAERAPCPVVIFDAKGDLGSLGRVIRRPVMRIDAMGAEFIARALDLSPAQAGALEIALAWADDTGRTVASLADLRSLLNDAMRHDMASSYGLVSASSVAAVQRAMLRLERSAAHAFGSNTADIRDASGIEVFACSEIAAVPGLYGAFVAHKLDSLYRGLGELGDVAAPGLLIMIDEAHLLFDGATPAIVARLEQVTRLIRSKGVGLIYVTQSPLDLPDAIAGQLASRIQHALRGATERQRKEIRAAAETMPGAITMDDVLKLATGEALVSVPDASGRPMPARAVRVQRGAVALHSVDLPPFPPVAVTRPRLDDVDDFQPDWTPAKAKPWPWWRFPLILAAVLYGLVAVGNLVN